MMNGGNNNSQEESQSPYHHTFPAPGAQPTLDQPSSSSSSLSYFHTQPSQTPPPPPPQTGWPSMSTDPAAAGSSATEPEKWGTHVMGAPAVPTSHPSNQKAALWTAPDHLEPKPNYPYWQLQYAPPVEKHNTSPMESILHKFNSWSRKAETTAHNIWHNLKTGQSVSGAAWDKVNLTAKAITGGGFESLYKQTFATYPNEKLKKTFACYLSTTTGPVAGTIYLSNIHVAFCSDRPLCFTAPSGQETWSYYKFDYWEQVMVPLGNICAINPVVMRDNPSEKYLQIVTIDGHDFWFMGFVNYEKATRHLSESLGSTSFIAPGIPVPPAPAPAPIYDEK
ncbi:hypothetical protein NMG60_11006895 [Bertholletia excelsa]